MLGGCVCDVVAWLFFMPGYTFWDLFITFTFLYFFFSLSLYLLSYLVSFLFSPMCILSVHNEVIKTRSFNLPLFLLHLYVFFYSFLWCR